MYKNKMYVPSALFVLILRAFERSCFYYCHDIKKKNVRKKVL